MTLWMWVTKDKYELPRAVAYTVKELAQMVGKPPNQIESAVSRWKNGKLKKSQFIQIQVEDDKEDE